MSDSYIAKKSMTPKNSGDRQLSASSADGARSSRSGSTSSSGTSGSYTSASGHYISSRTRTRQYGKRATRSTSSTSSTHNARSYRRQIPSRNRSAMRHVRKVSPRRSNNRLDGNAKALKENEKSSIPRLPTKAVERPQSSTRYRSVRYYNSRSPRNYSNSARLPRRSQLDIRCTQRRQAPSPGAEPAGHLARCGERSDRYVRRHCRDEKDGDYHIGHDSNGGKRDSDTVLKNSKIRSYGNSENVPKNAQISLSEKYTLSSTRKDRHENGSKRTSYGLKHATQDKSPGTAVSSVVKQPLDAREEEKSSLKITKPAEFDSFIEKDRSCEGKGALDPGLKKKKISKADEFTVNFIDMKELTACDSNTREGELGEGQDVSPNPIVKPTMFQQEHLSEEQPFMVSSLKENGGGTCNSNETHVVAKDPDFGEDRTPTGHERNKEQFISFRETSSPKPEVLNKSNSFLEETERGRRGISYDESKKVHSNELHASTRDSYASTNFNGMSARSNEFEHTDDVLRTRTEKIVGSQREGPPEIGNDDTRSVGFHDAANSSGVLFRDISSQQEPRGQASILEKSDISYEINKVQCVPTSHHSEGVKQRNFVNRSTYEDSYYRRRRRSSDGVDIKQGLAPGAESRRMGKGSQFSSYGILGTRQRNKSQAMSFRGNKRSPANDPLSHNVASRNITTFRSPRWGHYSNNSAVKHTFYKQNYGAKIDTITTVVGKNSDEQSTIMSTAGRSHGTQQVSGRPRHKSFESDWKHDLYEELLKEPEKKKGKVYLWQSETLKLLD